MYMALKPFFIQKTVSFNAPGCRVQREVKVNGVQRLFIYQEKNPTKNERNFFFKKWILSLHFEQNYKQLLHKS